MLCPLHEFTVASLQRIDSLERRQEDKQSSPQHPSLGEVLNYDHLAGFDTQAKTSCRPLSSKMPMKMMDNAPSSNNCYLYTVLLINR